MTTLYLPEKLYYWRYSDDGEGQEARLCIEVMEWIYENIQDDWSFEEHEHWHCPETFDITFAILTFRDPAEAVAFKMVWL